MPDMDQTFRDKTPPVWDMSQERVFIENLLGQRFNFFLLFFSVVLAGSINAKNEILAAAVVTVGAIIVTMFALVLDRTQKKFDLILDNFLFRDESHPAAIIQTLADPHGIKSRSRRQMIGYHIPRLCCCILWFYTLCAWLTAWSKLP